MRHCHVLHGLGPDRGSEEMKKGLTQDTCSEQLGSGGSEHILME